MDYITIAVPDMNDSFSRVVLSGTAYQMRFTWLDAPQPSTSEIYTSPDAFNDVVAGLEGKGYTFLEASVQMVPQNYVKLTSEEDIKNMEKLLEFLEDNDDVQNVYHNWEQD